jgi:hypothetical protein
VKCLKAAIVNGIANTTPLLAFVLKGSAYTDIHIVQTFFSDRLNEVCIFALGYRLLETAKKKLFCK